MKNGTVKNGFGTVSNNRNGLEKDSTNEWYITANDFKDVIKTRSVYRNNKNC
jgi:hypothetical protein